jgi:hypothetical protein
MPSDPRSLAFKFTSSGNLNLKSTSKLNQFGLLVYISNSLSKSANHSAVELLFLSPRNLAIPPRFLRSFPIGDLFCSFLDDFSPFSPHEPFSGSILLRIGRPIVVEIIRNNHNRLISKLWPLPGRVFSNPLNQVALPLPKAAPLTGRPLRASLLFVASFFFQ